MGEGDTFIAKVAPDGSGLAYAGLIGGSGSDCGYGVAVDAIGSAYVVGYTSSSETFFPINGGPDLTYNGGCFDAVIAKVKGEIIPLDVDVQGNGVSIPDGDTTPCLTDDTDFGSVRMLG